MKLSGSSFHRKLKAKSHMEMQREADLRGKIEVICLEYPRAMATGGLLGD